MKSVAMMKTMVYQFLRRGVGLMSFVAVNAAFAQTAVQSPPAERYSLKQCIEIALQNNLQIRQQQLNVQNSDLLLQQAKLNRYPNANLFANQAFNGGYSIDQASNEYVNQTFRSNNFQASSSLTIFNGFALQNAVKQGKLSLEASQQNLFATQNTISITVVQNYLNVLTYTEQLDIARRQVEASRAQEERTQKLVTAGTLAEADLYTIRAQVANDQLAIVNAQNNVDLAKLALLQAMNIPTGTPAPREVEVERYQLEDPSVAAYPSTAQQVYETALQFMPDVKASDLQVKADAMGVQVAKSRLYPTLSVNGSLNSVYSNTGFRRVVSAIQEPRETTNFVQVGGAQYPVFSTDPTFTAVPTTFGQQIRNNFNRSLVFSLNIPIFNNSRNRNQVTSALLTQKSSEITADNTRLTLRQNIETAYTNMLAASNRYQATQIQVESFAQAFRAAESRFNAGAFNSVDYNIAKTNLDKSRADLVQAKYDYIFRTKILDFYQNRPLTF